MITLYNKNETDFEHNGIYILNNCTNCTVEENLNGYYGLDLEYPIGQDDRWKELKEDRVLKAPTPSGKQLFRINRIVKNINSITVEARHIFYDLLDNYIEDVRPTKCTGNTAIRAILNSTFIKHNFIGQSDIEKINTAYYIRQNPVTAIMGEDKNSFLNRWGGELVRDNFTIKLLKSMGKDNGVTIRYGKNLTGIEEDLDINEVVTSIVPTGLDENDNVIELPEKYIYSENISKYSSPKIKHIHFSDIKMHHNKKEDTHIDNTDPKEKEEKEQEQEVTREDVYRLLREKVKELYTVNKIDIPKINYRVNFIELSTTEEYKNYKILEKVNLGDTVTIEHKILDLNLKAKVIRYTWDCLTKKYIEIELGNFKKNINDNFNSLDTEIENLKEKTKEDKTEIRKIIDETDRRVEKTVNDIIKINDDTENLRKYIDSATDDIGAFKVETNELLASKVGNEEFASYKMQTADKISTEVYSLNNSLRSYVNQTAGSINSTVRGLNNKFASYREQTEEHFTDVITTDEFRSYKDETADAISSKVSSSKYNSFRYQTDNRLDSIVYSDGDIKTSRITQALEDDRSFIRMIADNIEIKPRSGVIEFPDGQDIDCRRDSIRLRYDYHNYIRIDDNNISFYNGSSGRHGRAFMSFDEYGVYVHGRRVKWQYE